MTVESPTPKKRTADGSGYSQAARMRQRRADPKFRQRERLLENLHKEVVRDLIAAHSEEYRVRLNEKRAEQGLPPLRLRGKKVHRQAKVAPLPDVNPEVVKNCRHNEGLRKFPYGTFCNKCGTRIR